MKLIRSIISPCKKKFSSWLVSFCSPYSKTNVFYHLVNSNCLFKLFIITLQKNKSSVVFLMTNKIRKLRTKADFRTVLKDLSMFKSSIFIPFPLQKYMFQNDVRDKKQEKER